MNIHQFSPVYDIQSSIVIYLVQYSRVYSNKVLYSLIYSSIIYDSLVKSGIVQYCPVQFSKVWYRQVQSCMVWHSQGVVWYGEEESCAVHFLLYYLVESIYIIVRFSLVVSSTVKYSSITFGIQYIQEQFGIVHYSPILSATQQYIEGYRK